MEMPLRIPSVRRCLYKAFRETGNSCPCSLHSFATSPKLTFGSR